MQQSDDNENTFDLSVMVLDQPILETSGTDAMKQYLLKYDYRFMF